MKTEQEKANDLINWLVKSTENIIMAGNARDNSWREDGRMKFDKEES